MCGVVSVSGVEVVSKVFWIWLLVWKARPSLEEAVSMLIGALVGVTNLERQSAGFIFGSGNPLKRDVIYGKLQTPSIDLVISIFSVEKTG